MSYRSQVTGHKLQVRGKIKVLSIFAFTVLATCNLSLAASFAESSLSSIEQSFLEGRYDKVIYESEKLIDARARHRDELYYLKGLSELKTGKFSDSRRTFEELLSKYPRSKRALDAYVGIGDAYSLENRHSEALKYYNDALGKFSGDKNISAVNYKISECRQKMGSGEKDAAHTDEAEDDVSSGPPQKETHVTNFTPRSASSIPREIPCGAQGSFLSIQVGCFKNRHNADKLSQKLRQSGYDSFVELPLGGSDKLYRVKVGKLGSRPDADNLASKLKRNGYKIKVCGE